MNQTIIAAAESNLKDIGVADAGIVALLGYGVVFLGLIALMIVVIIIGKCFVTAAKKKNAAQIPEVAASSSGALSQQPAAVKADVPVAPGAAGALKLHDVEPKTAAMIMAIVADKMGKPLNELRFLSIKEVK